MGEKSDSEKKEEEKRIPYVWHWNRALYLFLTQEIYLSVALFLVSTLLIENDCIHFCD